uniref:Large ribosomal subunit protein uL14 n=1 Tax=Globodera pallida TaxID=36090 RepID=A0A183CNW7_GLOPA
MSKRGRGGASGAKFRVSLALPVGAVINCADNTGAKNLFVIAVYGIRGRLNRMPSAAVGDMFVCSVKKGKPELRKKVLQAVVVRQRKQYRRKDGTFIYFEDNAGVIVNNKGEMKGSAITGPVAKEFWLGQSFLLNEMISVRTRRSLVVLTAIALWVGYGKYLFHLFENSRFFSHLSDAEREMTYRTEMGLYFSFYKTLISSDFSTWQNHLLKDNVTEYGHSINTLQRFNLYSEVLVALAFRCYKSVTKYFELNDQECWKVNRGDDLSPIESCEGLGNSHYFYVRSVFAVAGSVLPSIFIGGTIFSGYIGGLMAASAFIFNQGEATRVQWTPPLRESFAYPMFVAQIVLLTHILKSGHLSRFAAIAFTFFTTAFCVFWQLSPFIVGTQLGSLLFAYSLGFVPLLLLSSLWRLFTLSFLLSLGLLFGNVMLLNSLFFTSLFSIKMILIVRPLLLRLSPLPLFSLAHLVLYASGTLGIKLLLQRLFNITADNHVADLLFAKFTDSHTFHTRLYTCAPEFDFMDFETIRKLTSTWLLPLGALSILLLINALFKTEILSGNWRNVSKNDDGKAHVEMLYNAIQLGCFCVMALVVMRLKLFATPQICLLCSWTVNRDLLGARLAPFRLILAALLLAGMASRGWTNVREQLEIQGEYNNPEQERLFHWIDKNTKKNAVFAGTMALMANVKLSTLRPIFNHPHYESEEVRNRTLLVYSLYSRKPLDEVYLSLQSAAIQFYVLQPQQCIEAHPKSACSYLAMWDEQDPANRGRPSLCHHILEAGRGGGGQQIAPFRPVYWSSSYVVLAL